MKNSLKTLKPSQLLVLVIIFGLVAFLRTQGYGVEPAAPTAPAQLPAEVSPTLAAALPEASATPQAALVEPAPTDPASPTSLVEQLAEFDYFVLALSWSPDYCASNGENDPQQCSVGRKLGFVLHGLWPQYQKGYPSDCSSEKLPADLKTQFAGLYPNDKLFDHEWEKHGTCTGLEPEAYLELSRQLKAGVRLPEAFRAPESAFRTTRAEIKAGFVAANPGFAPETVEVSCSGSGRYLKEIYVCFARDGQPLACSAEMQKTAQKSCQAADFIVRNTR